MSEVKKDIFREVSEEETVPVEETVEQNVAELFKVVGTSEENSERIDTVPFSYWRITFKELFKKPFVIVCIALILLVVFFTIFGPMINYYPPVIGHGIDVQEGVKFGVAPYFYGPNATNWFGVCGENMGPWFKGTDMWSCVWQGARLSLLLGVVVALIDTVLGIAIGAAWGYFRWLDPILIEFRNFVNNIPTLLLDILLMQMLLKYMTDYGFIIIVFLLCALGWLGLASFVRNQIIIIRNREYNVASQTLGSSSWTMISHNLLPYLVSVIVTVVSTAIPQAISAEVGLAYFNLSFKVSDGDITLGQVLTQAVKDNSWMSHPYLLLGPMIVMVPLTIAFFYLGLALSDATDPKTHR
ncbi:MAG: ABC transporter permease [Erysipelotrichaceae bacterium]|nr:ABC transporter permease [Erysipelotrichaceae bacterium]